MPEEYLLVTDGASQGARVDLGSSAVTIGREDGNDLVLDDTQASRRHARIAPADDGWSIEDLGSTNGTFLNGQRLTSARPLTPRDEIRIGRTVIALRSDAAHTEIGSPEALGLTSAAPEQAPAPAAAAPPPPVAAPPPPPAPAPAPPPPAPAPVAHSPGLAAPNEEHGYPAARPLTGHHGPPAAGPPPPAYRAVPGWQGGGVAGERDPNSGIRALRSDKSVRQRAYVMTFVLVALVALAVVLFIVTQT